MSAKQLNHSLPPDGNSHGHSTHVLFLNHTFMDGIFGEEVRENLGYLIQKSCGQSHQCGEKLRKENEKAKDIKAKEVLGLSVSAQTCKEFGSHHICPYIKKKAGQTEKSKTFF